MCFGVRTSLSPGVEVLDPEAFHAPDGTPAGSVTERPGAQGKSHDHSSGPPIMTYGLGHPFVPDDTLSQPSHSLPTH